MIKIQTRTGVTNIDVDNNIFIGNDAGIESSGNSNICLGGGAVQKMKVVII